MNPILTENHEKIRPNRELFHLLKFDIMKCLKEAGIKKVKGYTLIDVITFLITLVFSHKNLYAFIHSSNKDPKDPGKDAFYDFLGNWFFDWRLFLLKASGKIINDSLEQLTSGQRVNVLIADDSIYERSRSRKVELLARVFDHCTGRYSKGFRKLTLGWSDGAS